MRIFNYLGLLFCFAATSSGNPVAVDTPYTMIGEHVLIGITDRGAVVSGRYRFHVTPDATDNWGSPPYPLRLWVPVPVPGSLSDKKEIAAEVRPFITVKGTRLEPLPRPEIWRIPGQPEGIKIAAFFFWISRRELGEELDIDVQYDQPIISSDGRDMVYYIPFLPTFQKYEKQLRLRPESFVVEFAGTDNTFIRLLGDNANVERSEPHLVSVHPKNFEAIAVERIPSQSIHPLHAHDGRPQR